MEIQDAKQARPHCELIAELLDSRQPKTEREHAAVREIERLRHDIERHIAIASEYATECERLRAENAELQNELTKGIRTCGPTCRKTPRCAEMADLREELVDTKAALFSAEMRAQSAEKPNCKTCDHYIPPLSFAGEPACEFANTESVLVCVNGDAYIGTDPVRLYETGGG